MDATDRALLQQTVHDAVASAAAGGPLAVDAALDAIGWREMLAEEPDDAVAIVFAALGSANAAATALDDVAQHALGLEARPDIAVLLPPFGTSTVRDRGLTTARAATATELLVVEDDTLVTVPMHTVELRPVRGIDPGLGLHAARLGPSDAPRRPNATGGDARARARRAIGYEIAGASRSMLGLAREHALGRVQFGRPVAGFQAVRHRLAEALVAIEALDATLVAARDEPGPLTAALAKATAGRTARTVAAHCQQVLGGIGFTTDHPFHRFLKRTIALDGLFGATEEIALALGRRVLAERRVPTLIEL